MILFQCSRSVHVADTPPCFVVVTASLYVQCHQWLKNAWLHTRANKDCSKHVQKCMGTALWNAVQKHKGESGWHISSKGHLLTGNQADKLLWLDSQIQFRKCGPHAHCSMGNIPSHDVYWRETQTQFLSPWPQCSHCKEWAPTKEQVQLAEAVSDALHDDPVYKHLSDKKLL